MSSAAHGALESGLVSVVVLNYRGTQDTLACLQALTELDFDVRRLDLICVDNASGDGSFERLTEQAPAGVRVVASPVNGGFTGGCNFGAALARGEYLAFINNDARPDRAWLTEAITVLAGDAAIGCVASKVLDWEGVNVDYTGAALAWYGMGYKPGAGLPDDGTADVARDVLFATGSALVTRTELFTELGGFDERYFMFYEDVDFGWRLNLMGHRVRYVPSSLVFHRHHQSMKGYGSFREWYLLERNALMTLYKNVQDDTLSRVLAPALALSVRRGLATGEVDSASLDLALGSGGDEETDVLVSKQGLTGAFAVDGFVELLPSLQVTRTQLQQDRTRTDRQLAPLMGKLIEPALPIERYLRGHDALVQAFALTDLFAGRNRVLVVTGDPLTGKMAGPAIRAFHIAQELAVGNDVRLLSTSSCEIQDAAFECGERAYNDLMPDVAWADVVVLQGFLLLRAPWIGTTDAIVVVDLYDPMHVEQLEQSRGEDVQARSLNVNATTEVLNDQLTRGDFFICASEKQRDFWLGQLAGMSRLNPRTYDSDPTLRSLIDVVPFGLPSQPAHQRRSAIRDVVPGISRADKVIVWAGGIYDWFDPLTLIRAMAILADRRPDVRLFFLGTQHPNPEVPAMDMVIRTRTLADELELSGRHVFFNEGWVDYNKRADYLLDANVGVSTHTHNLETTLSFRTRILDYLWTGLPMVVTSGDAFADLVEAEGLGVVVPERDPEALAAALELCLYDAEFAKACTTRIEVVREQFRWPRAVGPLAAFCAEPRRAADAVGGRRLRTSSRRQRLSVRETLVRDAVVAREYLNAGGPAMLGKRAVGRLQRLYGERRAHPTTPAP
ncbi:MAG: glycosyltransferase domain containing protein [Frankiales bacterium]|nr:glycosyltransferase domain containing protein [Frankiales bacterium]